MGVYYYLLNDTKRERVHLDHYVKRGPLTHNRAVHYALCNYMLMNVGDVLRLCDDTTGAGDEYTEVDLLTYKFDDPATTANILNFLRG